MATSLAAIQADPLPPKRKTDYIRSISNGTGQDGRWALLAATPPTTLEPVVGDAAALRVSRIGRRLPDQLQARHFSGELRQDREKEKQEEVKDMPRDVRDVDDSTAAPSPQPYALKHLQQLWIVGVNIDDKALAKVRAKLPGVKIMTRYSTNWTLSARRDDD
jgi:hypothetical protein